MGFDPVFFNNFWISGIFEIKTGGYGDARALPNRDFSNVPGHLLGGGNDPIKKLLACKGIGENLGMGQNHIGF